MKPFNQRRLGSPVALAGMLSVATVVAQLVLPQSAAAHAIGGAYPLPVPLWMMLAGAGLAVGASFVVAAMVVRTGGDLPRYPSLNLPGLPTRVLGVALAIVGLAWWYGAIVAAFVLGAGSSLPVVLFWILLWAGLPLFSVVLGNPWPSLSPFRTTFAGLEGLARFAGLDRLDLGLPYPQRLGRLPAVFLLFAGLWCELVLPDTAESFTVGLLMLGYTLVTIVGMVSFGRVAWLRNAELFEVLLGWFGRIGPIGRRAVDPNACAGCGEHCHPDRCIDCPECAAAATGRERRPQLRPWIAGLTEVRSAGWSDAAFILLALTGVTYDGLRETDLFAQVSNWALRMISPPIDSSYAVLLVSTAGLLVVWLAFICAFLIGAGLTRLLSEQSADRGGLRTLVGAYASTLLPIAGGYLIAHYATLVAQGVAWLPELARDPRSTSAPSLDMIPAGVVWYGSVLAIVAGHVAAIFLAHRIALRDAPARPTRAGIPLAALMVAYTVLSLSIIAAPLATEPAAQVVNVVGLA